jgi:hypothetical protein
MATLAVRLGSGIVKAVPTALYIGTKRAQLEACTLCVVSDQPLR